MSNSQLRKLKPGIKNGNEVTINLSSNVFGYFNDKTILSNKLLLSNTQDLMLCIAFANNSSANTNYQKFNCLK